MIRWLIAIFILVPALEIWGLLTVGRLIGAWQTFALILLTGFIGAFFVRREMKKVWNYARQQMNRGQIPAGSILDGICIFAGGLMLLLPGFVTDVVGFLLVFPLTRPFAKVGILYLIQKQMTKGRGRTIYRP